MTNNPKLFMEDKMLATLAERVKKLDKGKQDKVVSVRDLRFSVGGSLHIRGLEYGLEITPHARTQLYRILGVPGEFAERILEEDTEFFAATLNFGIRSFVGKTVASGGDTRVMLRMRDDLVRAAVSPSYARFDNRDIVRALSKVPETRRAFLHSTGIGADHFSAKLLLPKHFRDDSTPDGTLRPGILIQSDEIGGNSLMVQPFLFRQSCTNDAVGVTSYSKAHRYSVNQMARFLEMSMSRSMTYGASMRDKLEELRKKKERYPTITLKAVAKAAKVESVIPKLVEAFQKEPGNTRFHVVNAFTRAAQGMDGARRGTLEAIGGRLIERNDLWRAAA